MKKLFFCTLTMALCTISLFAQDVYIKTEADINAFNYETVDNLYIQNSSGLTSISGFESLKIVKNDLIILGNRKVISLTGFNNLKTVNGNFKIEENPIKTFENAFNSLEYVGKGFCFKGFSEDELIGFSSLTHVDYVSIYNCGLKNIDFLSHLESVEGGILIYNNPALLNIDAFSKIKEMFFLDICNNAVLENVHGLSSLTKAEDVWISENNSLKDLSGLEVLDTIVTSLVITFHPNLVSINALGNLKHIGMNVGISHNMSLCECSVVADWLTNSNVVKGSIALVDNMPPCNSATMTSIDNINAVERIAVYPNPASDKSIFDFGNTILNYTISIYDINGCLVYRFQNVNSSLTVDWKENAKGIYLYSICSEAGEVQNGKIIVQ